MPEIVKHYLTMHDLKLVIAVIGFMAGGFVAWSNIKEDVADLKVRREVSAEQSMEQTKAVKDLTKAVQNLNITSAQLEVRLRNLETLFQKL